MLFYLQVVPPLETGKTICKDKVHKTIVHDPRIKVGHLADVIVTDDWRTLSFPTGSDAFGIVFTQATVQSRLIVSTCILRNSLPPANTQHCL